MSDDEARRARLRLVKGDEADSEPKAEALTGRQESVSSETTSESAASLGFEPGQFARMFDLSGRVALVTGGAGGLGSAIAMALADFGARVAVADINVDAAKRVARACARPRREGSIAFGLDVTKPSAVRAAVTAVEETAERIDILVNAVGVQQIKPALSYEPAEWRRILDVNLSGVFYITQAVGRGMVERGHGRVLSIGSVSSLLGHPQHAPYAASKGGVALLTKVLATEWAPHGVTVNALGPTYIETALNAADLADPAYRAQIVSKIPIGRLGTPEDIVGAAVFLCSDAGRFVTGQTLYVDGGRTAD